MDFKVCVIYIEDNDRKVDIRDATAHYSKKSRHVRIEYEGTTIDIYLSKSERINGIYFSEGLCTIPGTKEPIQMHAYENNYSGSYVAESFNSSKHPIFVTFNLTTN